MDFSSNLLSYPVSVSVRSLCLAAAAFAAIYLLRVKAAAARHAIWSAVLAGMLLLAVFTPVLPSIGLRVLPTSPELAVLSDPVGQPRSVSRVPDMPAALRPARPLEHPSAPSPVSWQNAAFMVYILGALFFLIRLAFSYLFTRKLVRASAPIDRPWAAGVHESSWISVPMTAGWLHPLILLPAGWDNWDDPKLQSVLAHERTHVRRADWAIALLAGVNRGLFWFHPLAWFLERRLASLAEQACDDSALLLVGAREHYAQALLDMAAAVKTGQGRLIWEAMAMAKAAEVRHRIERILDETRQIPRELTGSRWAVLLLCSLPITYLASVVHLVPAHAQDQGSAVPVSEVLKGNRQIGPGDVSGLEQYLASHPQDVEVRAQLILYYYRNGIREPRLSHIFWLIQNHPESNAAVFTSQGILPRATSVNSPDDFARALALWRQAAKDHGSEAVVLGNAAQFLSGTAGQLDEAERLLQEARQLQPQLTSWTSRLAKLYADAVLGATGDPRFPKSDSAFADHVKSQMEATSDGTLLYDTGSLLANAAQRPPIGRPLPAGVLNLDDHPMLVPAVDLGQSWMARAQALGVAIARPPATLPRPAAPQGGVVGGIVGSVPAAGPLPGVVGGVVRSVPAAGPPAGVLGGIISSVPKDVPPPALPSGTVGSAPSDTDALSNATVANQVMPVYPPLAVQARIQGDVQLMATVGADGSVLRLQALNGHPLLVPAAMEAARQWQFHPATRNGQPVESTVPISVPFRLEGMMPPPAQPAITPGTPASPTAPARIRIGGNVMQAKLLHSVEPVYPAQAKAENIEGSVTLAITIGEDGAVQAAEPVDGNPLLAAAAMDAVKQWTYQPTLLNGQPVIVMTTLTVPFQLH
jgi:TonB family protein